MTKSIYKNSDESVFKDAKVLFELNKVTAETKRRQ